MEYLSAVALKLPSWIGGVASGLFSKPDDGAVDWVLQLRSVRGLRVPPPRPPKRRPPLLSRRGDFVHTLLSLLGSSYAAFLCVRADLRDTSFVFPATEQNRTNPTPGA